MTKFIVLTLFKEMFDGFLSTSVIKRAIDEEKVSVDVIDIRDFSLNKHKKVDFPPYGGGSGMVMSCEPLSRAIDYATDILKKYEKEIKIIYLSPRGKLLNYNLSNSLANDNSNYILVCGHYEGIDERIIEEYNILEISIGDYVLTGGELASQVLMDSVIRLIPGVISSESLIEESHTNYLLEYPQYTKPDLFRGRVVPEILKSGNHKKIAEYRKNESIRITKINRPDLLKKYNDLNNK
ncbi:MAG: tRNA (guanosine(37)-N1)-methyltransferase TrmD [Clostridia bacterium]|jgi:tRNA (guanine37-N1)-methyltransferase|nr:tRNA (guanosine(37)-N1)-methyltransferase TrmD [Clostridia bacterium]